MVYILSVFSLKNSICFIILTYFVPVLFTFYIQCVLKLKKNISVAKRLRDFNPNKFNFLRIFICLFNKYSTIIIQNVCSLLIKPSYKIFLFNL